MARHEVLDHLAPVLLGDRFTVERGTIFTVICDAGFDRKTGSKVRIEGMIWDVLGWNDHRTVGSPYNGENIALLVGNPTCVPLFDAIADAEACGDQSEAFFLRGLRLSDGNVAPFPGDLKGDETVWICKNCGGGVMPGTKHRAKQLGKCETIAAGGSRMEGWRVSLHLRSMRLAEECQAIFDDADHWNREHPEEEPIDVDPDGKLRETLQAALDTMLATQPGGAEREDAC